VNIVSQEDYEEMEKVFAKFDKDGNGSITADELGDAMRWLMKDFSKGELQDMVREVDLDKDGRITLNEFLYLKYKSKLEDSYEKEFIDNVVDLTWRIIDSEMVKNDEWQKNNSNLAKSLEKFD
jgi:Ca2+-binding EF-hand superfamily protein